MLHKEEKVEDYLLLADFGIEEKDVHFIDEEDKIFEQSIIHFLEAKTVGADSEFRGNMTRFDPMMVATLQLATYDMTVIYDCVALQNSKTFIEFLD